MVNDFGMLVLLGLLCLAAWGLAELCEGVRTT